MKETATAPKLAGWI